MVASSLSASELMSEMVWVEGVEALDLEVEAGALAPSNRVGSLLLLPATMVQLLDLK